MSEPQIKKRIRKRSLRIQLESVLRSAQVLDNEPTNEWSIARMKFLQARLTVLAKMQARENNQKLKLLKRELAVAHAEIERLKQELESRPAESPVAIEINKALAKYGVTKKEEPNVI